jgi:hypothetical protein
MELDHRANLAQHSTAGFEVCAVISELTLLAAKGADRCVMKARFLLNGIVKLENISTQGVVKA